MANTRRYQICGAKEARPGFQYATANLLAAAAANVEIKDPQFTFNLDVADREILGSNLSSKQPLTGKTVCNVSFAVELAGSTVAATAPPWALYLEACGFRQATTATTTWSGTFGGTATGTDLHFYTGQIVQTASAAKTIRIIHDTYAGQTQVYYEAVVGTPANGDVYFPTFSDATVGPTLTMTAVPTAAAGFSWVPTSNEISTATAASTSGTINAGDVLTGGSSGAVIQALAAVTDGTLRTFRIIDGITATSETFTDVSTGGTATLSAWAQSEFPSISIALIEDGRVKIAKGCRGSVSISAETPQATYLNFTFQGILSLIQDGGPVTGVTYVSKIPPKFHGIDVKVGSFTSGHPGHFSFTSAHTPKALGFTMDMGGAASVEADATQSTGLAVGSAHQTSVRASQGSLKIGLRPEARFPWLALQSTGVPLWLRIRYATGTAASTNNAFLLSTPGALISGEAPGEQDGFGQADISLRLASRTPAGADSEGGEIVLTYLYLNSAAW